MTISTDTLKTDISYIKEMLLELKTDVKEIKSAYATKLELSTIKAELVKKIDEQDEDIKERLAPWNRTISIVSTLLLSSTVIAFIYLVVTHPASIIK